MITWYIRNKLSVGSSCRFKTDVAVMFTLFWKNSNIAVRMPTFTFSEKSTHQGLCYLVLLVLWNTKLADCQGKHIGLRCLNKLTSHYVIKCCSISKYSCACNLYCVVIDWCRFVCKAPANKQTASTCLQSRSLALANRHERVNRHWGQHLVHQDHIPSISVSAYLYSIIHKCKF